MRNFVKILCLTLATLSVCSQVQALTPNEKNGKARDCEALLPNVDELNECYFVLATEANDISLCDNIRWDARQMACRRTILYENKIDVSTVVSQAPFFLLILFVALIIVAVPPRQGYLYGAIIGAVASALVTYAHQKVGVENWEYDAYLPVLLAPVEGWLRFAPERFTALDLWQQLLFAHLLVYSVTFGLMLQGSRSAKHWGILLLLLSVAFSFWSEVSASGTGFVHQLQELLRY